MMENELPEGWVEVKLGDIITLEYGKSLPASERSGEGYPVMGSNGEVGRHKEYLLKGPGIVVGRKGSHGEVVWVDENFFPIDTTYYVIHKPTVLLSFAYNLLNYVDLKSLNRSTAIPGLNRNDAYEIKVPLPPLAEQRRIVAKLDEAFGHLETLKSSLARIPELLKKFRQTVLTQAVTGKLTENWREENQFNAEEDVKRIKAERLIKYKAELENSVVYNTKKPKKIFFEECIKECIISGWKKIFIEEIFDIETGATPKRDISEYWLNGTIPWIKSGQVSNGFITEADEFITEKALGETNTKLYPYNSILIAMYGEGKTRGQVGILKLEATSNQAIAAMVNPSLSEITISYVFYFALSQYENIRKEAVGGNQPNLNTGIIKKWQIDFPPLAEQEEIVRRVEGLFGVADRLEAQYAALRERIEALPGALLAKAFRGELVAQDPADEPATALLARIQAEAAKTVKKAQKLKTGQTELAFMEGKKKSFY